MAHPSTIGFNTPPENAFVVFKWVMIWLFACGLPCALAMGLPKWVPVPHRRRTRVSGDGNPAVVVTDLHH